MADFHDQMRRLSQQVAELEPRLGEVAAEYVELAFTLTAFINRFRQEVLQYHNQLLTLQRDIADVRAMNGERDARQPGEVKSPLMFVLDSHGSVQDQFDRTWGHKEKLKLKGSELPPAPPKVKEYYVQIVTRQHPELIYNPKEREKRREVMKKANQAYLRRDEITLSGMATMYQERTSLPALVDERMVNKLRNNVHALEILIARLEGRVFELRFGEIAKVKAHYDVAENEGRDLLQELNRDLQVALQKAQSELDTLRIKYDTY